jgi:hypothetical protein
VSCAGAAGSARLSAVPSVRCGAGHAFCAGCGLDADHRPIVCPLAAAWIKNAREDAGTSQWIKANTRECPKCKGIIEKGGGCKYACSFLLRGAALMSLQPHDVPTLQLPVLLVGESRHAA